MEGQKGIDWLSLWKKEDWWVVWIGFLIIALILAGLTIKTPKLRWTTDGEFKAYVNMMIKPEVEKLASDAEKKGEDAIKESAIALKTAIETADRKAIGEAAKKLENASKTVKDEGIKKKASKNRKRCEHSSWKSCK